MLRLRVATVVCSALVCAAAGDPPPKPTLVTGVVLGSGGAPLPEYTLALQTTRPDASSAGGMRTRLERVTTDAEGKFMSALTYTPGPVRFERIDRDGMSIVRSAGDLEASDRPQRMFEREHDGKPITLSVPCGPTFELTWKPHVPAEGEQPNGPAIGGSVARLFAPNGIDDGWSFTTTIRALDEKSGWVRFGGLPMGPLDSKPERLMLEVITSDGLWKSVADVTELKPPKGRRVELVWKTCCRLIGLLEGVRPAPGERIWLYAERLDEGGAVIERRRKRVEADSRAVYRGLDAGKWRLSTRTLRYHPWVGEPIDLTHAARIKTKVDLKRYAESTTFRGFAKGGPVVDGGREPRPGLAWIAHDSGEPIPTAMIPLDEQPLVWKQRDGEWRADVEFVDIVAGAYLFAIAAPDSQDAPELNRLSFIMNSTADGPIPGISWLWPESRR